MTNHVIWNELGLVHFNAGALPQAINAYQNAIESDKAFLPARLNLARAYTRNGNVQKAEQTYYSCFDLAIQHEEQADIWTHLGQLYAQTGRQDESQAAYNKADSLRASEEIEDEEEMELIQPEEIETAEEEPETLPEMEPDTVISTDTQPEEAPFARLKLEDIYINPRQPRMRIHIEDLVESIREHGVIQPILVSPNGENGHYILISGQRRLEAARQVGLETIPAVIRQVDDRERLELALTENLQRLSLSSIEEAEAYAELKKEFDLTSEEIARRMGKSSIAISNLLEQRSLPDRIKRALDVDRISSGHARALLKLNDPAKQLNAFEQILQRDLSVRKTEALVRLLNLEQQQEIEAIDEPEYANQEEWLESDDEEIITATKAEPAVQELPEAKGVVVVAEITTPLASSEQAITPTASPEEDMPQNLKGLPELAQLVEEEPPASREREAEKPQTAPLSEDLRLRIIAGENVVTQNPGNEEAWRQLAENYKKMGEHQKAIHAYQKALSLAPDNSTYFDKLGHTYIETGQYAEATDCFEQALSLDDKNIYLHCALASSYRRQGLEDEARFHIDLAAAEMADESPYNRACFESIYGNTDLALELLARAIQEDDSVTPEKIENDPDFDFIRQDERFTDFLDAQRQARTAPIAE